VAILAIALVAFFVYNLPQGNHPTTFDPTAIPVKTALPLYSEYTVITDNPSAEISENFGANRVTAILEINRIDDKYLKKGDVLVIPPTGSTMLSLSPFPATLPTTNAIPKILLVSQRVQSYGAYENGKLVRWGAVSSGKVAAPTENGLYFSNWKGKKVISTVDEEWTLLWNVNIDNTGGVSVHQYDVPGYPASHSCVRLFAADAEWFYNWTDQWILSSDGKKKLANGTPVIIFSNYEFEDITAPWENLVRDPLTATVIRSRLDKALQSYIPTILREAEKRAEIIKSTNS